MILSALVIPICCLHGQVAPTPAESPSAETPAPPQPATAPAKTPSSAPPGATASASPEDVIRLNPFEIQADSSKRYGAPSSNSITGFSADLDKLPIGADIFDEAFMRDVGATGVEEMIQSYSAGAGFAAADPAAASANLQPGDFNGAALQLRGLASPSMLRDGFMQVGSYFNPGSTGAGFSSNFDIERVEVINGPQSILYGASGGGGVVNTVSKQARLGQPAFGSLFWRFDQYGNKQGVADYGVGTDTVAARFSVINQDVAGRRANIGGGLNGYYAQFAFKVLGNTTLRLTSEDTAFDRINSTGLTLTAASTSNDARNGQNLQYLLATNQIRASANGAASGAGVIDNGFLNWGNVNSLAGWQARELTVNTFSTFSAQTEWNSWLSTEVDLGYDDFYDDRVGNTLSFYAPNTAANPLGVWSVGETGTSPMSDTVEPSHSKAVRASALIARELFAGRAHSRTSFGADYSRDDQGQISYEYFQAGGAFNILATSTGSRTAVPAVYWPVAGGPIAYPLWDVGNQKRITYNGINYVRAVENPPNSALVSISNPQGVAGTNGNYIQESLRSKGVFALNYTSWMEGKLDTLFGVRAASYAKETYQEGATPFLRSRSDALNFNAGADYAVLGWLHFYAAASDAVLPPLVQSVDPYGAVPKTANSVGEEAGVKVQDSESRLSGSLGIYHTLSKNEEYSISSTILNDINPSGLNGRFNNGGTVINVDRSSEGLQLAVNGAPNANLRMRLSAALVVGKIASNTSYGQLYNDQFHEDSKGDVTYANGDVAYVSATFNSKAAVLVAPAPTAPAGYVPLTVANLGNPASTYYANPVAVNGQINPGSNAAKVLEAGNDPKAGRILTGATGLPISNIQINPGFSPPGTIVTSRSGDDTTGYPECALNNTNVYTFSSGWAKGFRIGDTLSLGWKRRMYYYYPYGITPTAVRTLFSFPDQAQLDLIFGYSRKYKGITWSAQLNVYNAFNRYHVLILPNSTAGWAGPNNATFDFQPRSYVVSNTISF